MKGVIFFWTQTYTTHVSTHYVSLYRLICVYVYFSAMASLDFIGYLIDYSRFLCLILVANSRSVCVSLRLQNVSLTFIIHADLPQTCLLLLVFFGCGCGC